MTSYIHTKLTMKLTVAVIIIATFVIAFHHAPQATAQTDETQDEAFAFQHNLDPSLPDEWIEEFKLIMANLDALIPIPSEIYELEYFKSPMPIYAWNSAVSNPFPQIPGAEGASISGNGTDTWMVLEISEDEFVYDDLHRYSVIVHEYFHVYQSALSQDNAQPIWLWEGGAKTIEELYVQQVYGESQFDYVLFPVYSAAVETPERFEDYIETDEDQNYNGSTFLVLALVKELQTQGITEERAFEMVLKDFQAAKADGTDWETAFENVFSLSVADFYASLGQYPVVESQEDWVEGMVVDISAAIPSTTLALEDIFVAAD